MSFSNTKSDIQQQVLIQEKQTEQREPKRITFTFEDLCNMISDEEEKKDFIMTNKEFSIKFADLVEKGKMNGRYH